MKESYKTLLWSSFKQVYGPIVSVLSIPFAVLIWVYLPTQKVPLSYLVILGYIITIVILTLAEATYKSFEANKIELPRIINSRKDQMTGYITCILEPSSLFSQGILVSFYHIDSDDFEILIGVGQVILIQRDGKVQVSLNLPTLGQEEILEEFGHNDENIKNKIYVKPTMNTDMLQR